MNTITPTRQHAEKIVELLGFGVTSGLGVQEPGKMCVEALVCYALGLPHGDDPGCVDHALRRLKIRLNDAHWPSSEARAAGLRRLAIAQLGSAGALDTKDFVRRVARMTIQVMVPIALRATARRNPKYADALEAAAVRCEQEGTTDSARNAQRAARATATAAAAADAYAYAYDAAAVAADAARVKVLSTFAEAVVQILIEMHAPGRAFLDLVPLEVAP